MNWTLTLVCTFLALAGSLPSLEAGQCNPYPHADASHCSAANRRKDSFKELSRQLEDASTNEHLTEFVINSTIGFYQFLHPCASTVEAALRLFYGEHSTIPDSTSHWWGHMSQVLKDDVLIGRRRRSDSHQHYLNEEDLLNNELRTLLHETGNDAGCLQYLIEQYKGAAGRGFKQRHPNFNVPPTTTTPTTTTTIRTTTTQRPTTPKPTTQTPTTTTTVRPTAPKSTTARTTTPKPTTPTPTTTRPTTPKPTTARPTTPKPTTARPTTPKPTTARPITPKPTTARPTTPKPTTARPTTPIPTTTPRPTTMKSSTAVPTTSMPSTAASTAVMVTYGPISCTTCSGLMCLLGSHVTACPDGQTFCKTTVEETDTGRDISRGCASQAMCDSYAGSQDVADCSKVDSQILPAGVTCHFCCLGDNCNAPPNVKPATDTLYPKP